MHAADVAGSCGRTGRLATFPLRDQCCEPTEQSYVCVVGVGLADGPVAPNLTGTMLEAQAFRRALDDAGLEPRDVGGLASAGYGGMHEVQLAEYLGLTPHWLESTSVGGSSFEFQALHAYRAIQAGDVDTVAIVYGNNQLTAFGRTLGTGGGGGPRWRGAMPLSMSYEFPSGITLVGSYAMAARRHMHQYGTTPEQLASISVQTREHAGRNPNAMYRDPITVDDVLASKLVADPLHKLDCCVISDGGCCIIMTTEDTRPRVAAPAGVRARRGRRHDASLDPGHGGHDRDRGRGERPEGVRRGRDQPRPTSTCSRCTTRSPTRCSWCSRISASHPKGEGGPFVADGNLRLGGALPTNTDGGGLSSTHPGHARALPAVRSDASAPGRRRRRPGRGRRDRGRARQWRLVVHARHGRPRNGARMTSSSRRLRIRHARLERDAEVPGAVADAGGPRVLGRRAPRRAAHPALHHVRQAPALPAHRCARTADADTIEWVTATGGGTLYSYTVIRQNGVPPFKQRVPFVVATIDLDEAGARMLAAMPELAPEAATIGMRVRATFRPANDEFGFVDFAPA